jgi:LmbE family N-acetylglucosaminyl deacetylase
VLQALRDLSHAANHRVARDATDRVAHRSALVLAPHPDDETLGCGATIMRKVAAGTPVTIAVISDGSAFHDSAHLSREDTTALRHAETVEAARRMGLPADALRWYGYEDGALEAHEAELTQVVRELLDEIRPDEVYVTGAFEPHPDHCALGRAARRAVRGTDAQLLEYPIWLWAVSPVAFGMHTGAVARATLPMLLCRRVHKVRAEGYLDAKWHAIAAHDSQLNRPPTVPADLVWSLLPAPILRQARHPVELFLPWGR